MHTSCPQHKLHCSCFPSFLSLSHPLPPPSPSSLISLAPPPHTCLFPPCLSLLLLTVLAAAALSLSIDRQTYRDTNSVVQVALWVLKIIVGSLQSFRIRQPYKCLSRCVIWPILVFSSLLAIFWSPSSLALSPELSTWSFLKSKVPRKLKRLE